MQIHRHMHSDDKRYSDTLVDVFAAHLFNSRRCALVGAYSHLTAFDYVCCQHWRYTAQAEHIELRIS